VVLNVLKKQKTNAAKRLVVTQIPLIQLIQENENGDIMIHVKYIKKRVMSLRHLSCCCEETMIMALQ
jgi:hypothetical protein